MQSSNTNKHWNSVHLQVLFKGDIRNVGRAIPLVTSVVTTTLFYIDDCDNTSKASLQSRKVFDLLSTKTETSRDTNSRPVTHMEIQSVYIYQYRGMIVTVTIIVKYQGYITVFIWPCSGHNSDVVLLPHKTSREAIFATGSFLRESGINCTFKITETNHTFGAHTY